MSVYPNSEAKTEFSIHPATKIGSVSLTVANLDNQVAFYQQALGFVQHRREGDEAILGTGERELLRLVEQPGFKRYRGVTGLYHFAVLFPNRRELARVMARLFALKYRNYPTDHIMTKTTYLDDPEGNGIELYAESPEDGTWSNGTSIWCWGTIAMPSPCRVFASACGPIRLIRPEPPPIRSSPRRIVPSGNGSTEHEAPSAPAPWTSRSTTCLF